MKNILKLLIFTIAAGLLITACSKVNDLTVNGSGIAPVLTASSVNIAPPPADSNKVALTLTWTYPNHSTSASNIKYVVEIDSVGNNFSNPYTKVITESLSTAFTGKELNAILVNRGFAFNVPVTMEARVTSSYANNNEKISSNVLSLKMTPYKVPPKVDLPASGRLFIVGDATDFGWTNDPAPAFPASREFTKISETLYGGFFNMKGTGGFKLLQTQGVWSTQYHMVTGGGPLSGSFILEDADPAFSSPPVAGTYKVLLDFQSGRYTLTKVDNPVISDLYITGDATAGGWVNTPPANQQFTQLSNSVFELTTTFTGSGAYKFLSSFGNWSPQFGGTSATGGDLGANYGTGADPAAISSPAVAGSYKITVNFLTNSYTVVKL